MTFNPDAQLDPDQVTDVRGRTGGGRTLAFGGGGLGLVIAIAYLLLGGDPSALIQTSAGRRRRSPTRRPSPSARRVPTPTLGRTAESSAS